MLRTRPASRPAVEVGDEALVDLEARHREVLEVGERRVAGAEVVDRDPDAERAQLARGSLSTRWCRTRTDSVSSSVRQRRIEAASCSRIRCARRRRSPGWWSWTPETLTLIESGSGHLRFQTTAWRHASSSTQRPISTITPVSSAAGMNSAGETSPRCGMAPADQRLEAARASVAAHVLDRLVGDAELARAERLRQLDLEREPLDGDVAQRRVEHRHAALALRLRAVHRDVGVAQQRLGGAARASRR